MTVPTPSDSAPPPGLSNADYALLAEARSITAADLPVEASLVTDLVEVFDKVAARLAWLAASSATPQVPTIMPQDRVDLETAIRQAYSKSDGRLNTWLAADYVIEAGFHR